MGPPPAQNNGLFSTTRSVADHFRAKPHEKTREKSGFSVRTAEDGIGRNPMDHDNVFIVTGDSGNGMTHGTIAGLLITDLILDRPNPWEKIYNPSRVNLGAVTDYARENANMAAQYVDWLTAGDVEKERIVAPGTGAILRHGLTKIAVYRDLDGTFHECSAVCPHLGGIVSWNNAEKTWDCPAHGSRFDCRGKVMNGPANSNLKPLEVHSQSK
jgi:Rieske Fe-S protein